MTDYKITLSPDLGISVADFVAAWNEKPDCSAVAKAQLETLAKEDLEPFSTAAIAVLSGIAIGVAANTVHELAKKASLNVMQKVSNKNLEQAELLDIKEIPQADGSQLLVLFIRQNKL